MSPSSPDPDRTAALLELGSATLGESGGESMHPRISAAWPGARMAGPAFTARCAHGDNLAIHVAVAEAPPGSVLVAHVVPAERGYWGEVLTTAAESRGLAGLVIDGGVRDTNALEAHGWPVFSSMIALRGATKTSGGSIGGLVSVGEVWVHTGDWIVGDRDGVVVIAADQLDDAIAAGRARTEKETEMFRELRSGRTTIDLLGLSPGTVVDERSAQGT